MCSTVRTQAATFCANNGNNGLIDNAATTSCRANPCTIANDAATCCKQAGTGNNNNNNNNNNGNNNQAAGSTGKVQVTLDTKVKVVLSNDETNANNLKFVVTYQGTGWFGIGISADGTMGSNGQGTDMIICTSQGVERFWAISTAKPTNGVTVPGATCETSQNGLSKDI
jgi:hypothetical protein